MKDEFEVSVVLSIDVPGARFRLYRSRFLQLKAYFPTIFEFHTFVTMSFHTFSIFSERFTGICLISRDKAAFLQWLPSFRGFCRNFARSNESRIAARHFGRKNGILLKRPTINVSRSHGIPFEIPGSFRKKPLPQINRGSYVIKDLVRAASQRCRAAGCNGWLL